MSFAFLLIPAILALAVLTLSRFLYPHPHHLEASMPKFESKGFKKVYWLYILAVALIAAGYTDFPLISYHFQMTGVVLGGMIAIFYSVAMGVDAISALIFGRIFDKVGISIMISCCTYILTLCTISIFWRVLRCFGRNGNMGRWYGCPRIYNEGYSCRAVTYPEERISLWNIQYYIWNFLV